MKDTERIKTDLRHFTHSNDESEELSVSIDLPPKASQRVLLEARREHQEQKSLVFEKMDS